MKVGSLVELINDISLLTAPTEIRSCIKELPVTNVVYTVRKIDKDEQGRWSIAIEEICIGIYMGCEIAINIEMWRELQPPMKIDIDEIIIREILV